MSISFYPASFSGGEYSYDKSYPVFDAHKLYQDCVAYGIATDWWYPIANSVKLVAGYEYSTAHLLMTKRYIDGCTAAQNNGVAIDPINRQLYNHRINLSDDTRNKLDLGSFNVDGWSFHSARAIDGSSSPEDLDALYLVKFVDLRYVWSKTPGLPTTAGSFLFISREGYNILDPTIDDRDMDYSDPSNGTTFPYDPETIHGDDPYTWEQVLEILWYSAGGLGAGHGTTLWFQNDDLPFGGEYPEQVPIDLRPENKTAWRFFCDVLHATGNEIYPWLDGTFRIAPIDEHFGQAEDLDDPLISPYLIESGHIQPEDVLLPENMTMTFQKRHLGEGSANANYYETFPAPPFGTTPFAAVQFDDPLITAEEFEDSGAYNEVGVYSVSGLIAGVIEDVTSLGMTVVYKDNVIKNDTELQDFARVVLQKYTKSKADKQVDNTYGYFIALPPTGQYEEVTWFIGPNGPSTKFLSLPSTVGVDTLPPIIKNPRDKDTDRLVAADPTDDEPKTFIEKLAFTQTPGTWETPDTWQEVWGEVYTVGTDPHNDNLIRLYTALGTGEQGPPGPPGPADPDSVFGSITLVGLTYVGGVLTVTNANLIDGCGIIIAGDTIHFDPTDVVGAGLQVDPYATTACSIAVKPEDLVGCGLEVCSDNAANEEVRIKVKPSDLAGCGLMVQEGNQDDSGGPCKLAIKVSDIAGCGLKPASDNTQPGTDNCKMVIDLDAITNPTEGIDKASGDQDDANGPCKLKIKTNGTIRVLDPDNPPTLTLTGGNLELKIYYKDVDVYRVLNTTGNVTATTATTDCSS